MANEQESTPLSPYEKGDTRITQWRRDNGLYCGYSITPPTDENHPLRSAWELTSTLNTTRYTSDRHIVTVGPNGSGKTRRLLFPNLYYLKNWSIVAIDPKGELFAHTAVERAKAAGHRIVLIDPFAVVKTNYPRLAERISCESLGFNPIAALDPQSLRFIDDAKSLAVSLIKTEDTRDKYWPLAAQTLIKGLVMGLRIRGGPEASLVDLRDVLGLPPAQLAGYISSMIERLGEDWPAISASLGEFASYSADDRELGGIRRTAKVQTDWLDSPQMRTDLEADAFDFTTLKETPTTVYLALPPEFLATHGVWLRMMVASILRPLLRSASRPIVPVLFMLDEFAQLGRMEIIEDNYALMRGYGVKLWTIWQDLNQAKNLYNERWESFISNAGIVQSFAPQDMTTRKYLSELADERLTWHTRGGDSASFSISKGGASINSGDSRSDSHVKEPLVYPFELGQMGQGQSVLFTQRGAVNRVYFPDAERIPGVCEMMAEAAELCG
jgi:type IV secretion system protein VirD4